MGKAWIATIICLIASASAMAQEAALEQRLVLIGEVAPKSAREIARNDWSIGTETIDRDFSRYEAWRDYLGPLGAKHARLQSGWARTERQPGMYDFTWLDPVVAGIAADGVRPWFTLGFGNPAIPGGGSAQRDSDLPRGAARRAWLAYVRAIVTRYRDQVDYWELWNEPELIGKFTAEEFGEFAAETAQTVRSAQPDATISIAGFSGLGSAEGNAFIRQATRTFVARGGRGLAQVVGIHIYNPRPEGANDALDALIADLHTIDPGLVLRQGESGAPSINQPLFALSNLWWTEEAQAKWVLRRMLNDAARGMWTSVFTLTDLHYSVAAERGAGFNASQARKTAAVALNSKGLLETRRYDPSGRNDDKQVVRAKMGYRAMQSVTSIFDARLKPVAAPCRASDANVTVAAFRRDDGASAIVAWRSSDRPGEKPHHQSVDISCTGVRLADAPLYVDLLTSAVYRTDGVAESKGDTLQLTALPVYDAPVVVSDAVLVEMW
ncbi:hypothetical protein GO308_18265 [Sphingomonas sp. SFZ2018-12]|uniref:hypothetical protein n=1 Tax=Sphingomonas sp. SFZ2018-12 TaxID=2683197 RepID=UPI001F0D86EF|nr:hypothetical protein [Sphingomonas sp. SFZ2018-12]MCH4895048.1 hypothetical protein [Sphingomonas sp. SFZ2018-12]